MTKPEKIRLVIMLPILALLLYFVYTKYQGASAPAPAFDATGNYQPMTIENPALRFDLIAHSLTAQYTGRHRNIFDDKLPVEIKQPQDQNPNQFTSRPVDTGPGPLVFPLKCFGFVEGPATGMRRAFFTDGDDVFIAGIGDTILNRFRLLRIGNDTVEVEELGGPARRATVAMEQETHSP